MPENARTPEPLAPKNLNELLSLRNNYPGSVIYAGGTYLLRHYSRIPWPQTNFLIYLGNVKELDYITRTERYIEFGACASFSRILQTCKNVIPTALYQAMNDIGTSAVKNMATIGGNLCVPERRMSLFPVLLLMDVKIELRKQGKNRWVSVKKFIESEGRPDIQDDEILTRLRLPFNRWKYQIYLSLGKGLLPPEEEMIFCGLADIDKNLITDLRISFGTAGTAVFRNLEIESGFIGSTVPLPEKKLEMIDEILGNSEMLETQFTPFQKKRIKSIMLWYLQSIEPE